MEPTRTGRLRRVLIPIIVAIAALLIWAAVVARHTIRELLRQEDRLHAMILTCDLVRTHLEDNNFASWPTSWAELRLLTTEPTGGLHWPRDAERVESLVEIDFQTELSGLDLDDVEGFAAIRPRGPTAVVYRDHAVRPLLDRIRKGLAR